MNEFFNDQLPESLANLLEDDLYSKIYKARESMSAGVNHNTILLLDRTVDAPEEQRKQELEKTIKEISI